MELLIISEASSSLNDAMVTEKHWSMAARYKKFLHHLHVSEALLSVHLTELRKHKKVLVAYFGPPLLFPVLLLIVDIVLFLNFGWYLSYGLVLNAAQLNTIYICRWCSVGSRCLLAFASLIVNALRSFFCSVDAAYPAHPSLGAPDRRYRWLCWEDSLTGERLSKTTSRPRRPCSRWADGERAKTGAKRRVSEATGAPFETLQKN